MPLDRERLPSAREPSLAPCSLRIIVADDDRDTVLMLMLLLREEGHGVRGVHSASQVLKAVNEFNPDVVLLDIAMPELSGGRWHARFVIALAAGRS